MKSRYVILIPIILLALLIPLAVVHNQLGKVPKEPSAPSGTPPVETVEEVEEVKEIPPAYTNAPPSPDGIGKIFMGREISHVMGHQGLRWLERDEREFEEAPSRAIALLDLAQDAVIADIGAGSGYYSFRISPLVPKGKVVAVDIQQEMLDFLKAESAKREVTNVQPHLGDIDDIQLPPDTLDAALMVDAYHEFSHPIEMLSSLHKALKPGGKIYLLEYRSEDPRVPIKPLHKMSEAQARKEFEALGFTFVENKKGLPWQHFLVFEKPDPDGDDAAVAHIRQQLESIIIPMVSIEGAALEEAVDFVRSRATELGFEQPKRAKLWIRLSPANPQSFEIPISLKLRDASMRVVLENIAEQVSADIHIRSDIPRFDLPRSAPTDDSGEHEFRILSTIYRHTPSKTD